MMVLKKGQTNSGSFKKGCIPWNKGKKGLQKAWNKGIPNPKLRDRNLKNNPAKMPGVGKKIGESRKGKKNWNWIGGCRRYFQDRVYRRKMEKVLGRKLRSNEIIHHIDGNWKNNNINNLMVVTRSEHAKIHWKQRDIQGRPRL